MKAILFDYVNGVKAPIGKVEFVENFTPGTRREPEAFEETVGLWRTKTGDFYICKKRYRFDSKSFEFWAEIISEPEAKFIAIKSPAIYEKFFLELPDIECEDMSAPQSPPALPPPAA